MPKNTKEEVLDYEPPPSKKRTWYSDWGEYLIKIVLSLGLLGRIIAVLLGAVNIGWAYRNGHPLIAWQKPWTLNWEFKSLAINLLLSVGFSVLLLILPKSKIDNPK